MTANGVSRSSRGEWISRYSQRVLSLVWSCLLMMLWLASLTLCKAQIDNWAWTGGSSSIQCFPTNGTPICGSSGVYLSTGVSGGGNLPGGRVGAVSWTDKDGNLRLFGGLVFNPPATDPLEAISYFNDLWQYDPATQNWTWLGGSSAIGSCTLTGSAYFSPMTACGWPGSYGTEGTPSASNIPGGRMEAGGWVDHAGNLWVFGGYGFDSNVTCTGELNDLWKLDGTSAQWTWIGGSSAMVTLGTGGCGNVGTYGTRGTASANNIPGGRYGAAVWTDKNGRLWLFGGAGLDSTGKQGRLNDVWEYDPSATTWTWMGGSSTFAAGTNANPGVYGTRGTPSVSNIPGSRSEAVYWTDSNGNFWLFGGFGFDSGLGFGYLDDLWKFDSSTTEWTWVAGDSTHTGKGKSGVYGSQGTGGAGNHPGGRLNTAGWVDPSGNLWLIGGEGLDASGVLGSLNDVWEYNVSSGLWIWMGGAQVIGADGGQPGVYAFLGDPSADAQPGSRYLANTWTDRSGGAWLFGGYGFDLMGNEGVLNDLWRIQFPSHGSQSPSPVFGPASGTYSSTQQVTISDADSSASIYYTTDGSLPTQTSTPYSGSIAVSSTETIKAIAIRSSSTPSLISDAAYSFQVAEPTFSLPAGNYSGTQSVTIHDSTPGAAVFFTLDGTVPTSSSTAYTGSINVSQTTVLRAVAEHSGYQNSPIASITYTFGSAIPNSWVWVGGQSAVPCYGLYGSNGCDAVGQDGILGVPNPANLPVGRSQAASWTDTEGNFWLFGGETSSGVMFGGSMNDLWKLSPANNDWTWVGGNTNPRDCYSHLGESTCTQNGVFGTLLTPSVSNIPPGNAEANSWSDSNGDLWLFGGSGANYLWKFDPPSNEWEWVSGSSSGTPTYGTLGKAATGNAPGERSWAVSWRDGQDNLWLFGGEGQDANGNVGSLNDLWRFTPSSNEWAWMGGSNTLRAVNGSVEGQLGVYGTLGVPSAANVPGARFLAATWVDASGHFWLFGGAGYDANGSSGYLNDLWRYDVTAQQWTWMSGSSTIPAVASGVSGVYGQVGVANSTNFPGGRYGMETWVDKQGNLWLFGGEGFDSAGHRGQLNDLWEFNVQTGQWTWMSGNAVVPCTGSQSGTCVQWGGQAGVYGVLNQAGYGTNPGGRQSAVAWTDTNGDLWLFGGHGYDQSGTLGNLNDLWVYKPQGSGRGKTTPLVTLTPSASNITSAQAFSVSVVVSGGTVAQTPTGTVVLSSGNYSSSASTLSGGRVTISVPAGSLAAGSDVLTATYSPDSGSSSTFSSASGTTEVSVIASGTITPTVTLNPASSTINVTQSLSVGVTVSGGSGNPTPTGSITLTSGTYTSAPTTLNSGGATISIPPNSLSLGTDILSATYNPDSAGASTYTSASGSATVTVTSPVKVTPTLTVTPSQSSISTAQSLTATVTVNGVSGNPTPTGSVALSSGTFSSGAMTLSRGSAVLNVPAGSLTVGKDTLTATYTPDSASSPIYTNASGSATVTVTAASYSLSATNVTVNPGGTGTSTITISAVNGYSGTISLACSITSFPSGAIDHPTCSATSPVTLSSTSTNGTASVSVGTTAPNVSLAVPFVGKPGPLSKVGGEALLALVMLAISPRMRRRWRSLIASIILTVAIPAISSCGGGSSGGCGANCQPTGTTPGLYTITVSGTGNDSAKTKASTTFTLTVD